MRVGVVGAGTMGAGIAQVAAASGFAVSLYDVSAELAERGRARIAESWERQVTRGRLTAEERDAAQGRITVATDLAALADAALVIEATTEDLSVKQELFAALERACAPTTILASNTSSLSIGEIARGLGQPARVVGLHFFNPAPAQELIEVIGGARTAPETIEQAEAFARQLGKTPVRALDTPGFIG